MPTTGRPVQLEKKNAKTRYGDGFKAGRSSTCWTRTTSTSSAQRVVCSRRSRYVRRWRRVKLGNTVFDKKVPKGRFAKLHIACDGLNLDASITGLSLCARKTMPMCCEWFLYNHPVVGLCYWLWDLRKLHMRRRYCQLSLFKHFCKLSLSSYVCTSLLGAPMSRRSLARV